MKSERNPFELEFHASPIKAGITAALGALLLLAALVVLMPQAARFTWEWWAYVLIGVLAAWLLWEGARRFVAPSRLSVSPSGVTQTIWPWEHTLAWSQIKLIDVNEVRGMQMLMILRHSPGRPLMSSGWNKTPYEIQAEIHEARVQWGGVVASDQAPPADVVPPRRAEDRNRLRRTGMTSVLGGTALCFLGMMNVRMMGPHERPPGVDFQWASPPTTLGGVLMVIGIMLSLFGFWRWLWPIGKPASPPLFSTLAERFVFTVGCLVPGVGGYLLLTWMQHPA